MQEAIKFCMMNIHDFTYNFGAVHKFHNTFGGWEGVQSNFSLLFHDGMGEERDATNFVMSFTYFSLRLFL